MYSELVEQYSIDLFNLTRQFNNGQLGEDENYFNEIKYLLEEFERKVRGDNKC